MKNPLSLKPYAHPAFSDESRVYRSGSWSSYPVNIGTLWRDHDPPTSFYYYGYGFRLFRSEEKL